MAINQRAKGARGERSAAAYLRGLGFDCDRAARLGKRGGEDLMFKQHPHLSVEVKRVEAMTDHGAAMDSAIQQAQERNPVAWAVLWRRNRQPWRLTFHAGAPGVRVTVVGDARIRVALLWLAAQDEPIDEQKMDDAARHAT